MLFVDDGFTKINEYAKIVDQLVISCSNVGDITDGVKKNKALTFQLIGGFSFASQCAAALYTKYETRSSAISAIELLETTYNIFINSLEEYKVSSTIEFSFTGDYEFLNEIYNIYTKTRSIILRDSFSLSMERIVKISEPSDAITLCWEYYKDVSNDKINFFLKTNKIKGDQFLELPSGMEVLFYVD